MADCIQIAFGMLSGVSRHMGVLDGVVIVEGEGAVLGGEFGPCHCNQWEICCIVVWKCVNQSSYHFGWWLGLA